MKTRALPALIVTGLFLLLLVAFKAEWIDRMLLTETSGISSVCMASYFGLVCYAALVYVGLRMIGAGVRRRGIVSLLTGVVLLVLGIGHATHLVVRDDNSIQAKFLLWEYRSAPFDLHVAGLNMGGYDAAHHWDARYDCYEYCESFFVRRYQTAAGQHFAVYRGLLPFLGLSDDHWWPQTTALPSSSF